jgi:hypothetical protein
MMVEVYLRAHGHERTRAGDARQRRCADPRTASAELDFAMRMRERAWLTRIQRS